MALEFLLFVINSEFSLSWVAYWTCYARCESQLWYDEDVFPIMLKCLHLRQIMPINNNLKSIQMCLSDVQRGLFFSLNCSWSEWKHCHRERCHFIYFQNWKWKLKVIGQSKFLNCSKFFIIMFAIICDVNIDGDEVAKSQFQR